MDHCIAKIREIVASGRSDRRAVFQIGYNLGRLSELTGLGRGPFWDTWKGPIEEWDVDQLNKLALELQSISLRHDGAPEVATRSVPSRPPSDD